jgi:hypothetical protein
MREERDRLERAAVAAARRRSPQYGSGGQRMVGQEDRLEAKDLGVPRQPRDRPWVLARVLGRQDGADADHAMLATARPLTASDVAL